MADSDVTLQMQLDLAAVKKSFDTVKKDLDGLKAYVVQFGESVKTIGIAAFAWHVGKAAFGEITSLIRDTVGEMQKWIHEAETSELANERLALAVKNSGKEIGYTTKQLMDNATALANRSIFGSTEITEATTKLINLGKVGSNLKDILNASLDVSSVVKGRESLEGTVQAIGRAISALNATGKAPSRLLINIVSAEELSRIHSGAELIALLEKKYSEAADKIAGTGYGIRKAWANLRSDIEANLGGGFLEFLKAIKEPIQTLLIHVKSLAAEFKAWLTGIAEGDTAENVIKKIKDTVIDLFARVEKFFAELPTKIALFFAELKLSIDQLVGSLPEFLGGTATREAKKRLGNNREMTPEEKAEQANLFQKYQDARKTGDREAIVKAGQAYTDFGSVPRGTGVDYENIRVARETLKGMMSLEQRIERIKAERTDEGKLLPTSSIDNKNMFDTMQFMLKPQFETFNDHAGKVMFKTMQEVDRLKSSSLSEHQNQIRVEMNRMAMAQPPKQEFKSAIEDAQSVFRRIQVSAASREEDPQLKVQTNIFDAIKQKLDQDKGEAVLRKEAWENLKRLNVGIGK